MNQPDSHLSIGCVADDFTGASDAASFLANGGLRTALVNGIPNHDLTDEFDAIVIALKSRTQTTNDAVRDCLAAMKWLRNKNSKTLYFKYCSTFDSTPKGNIGPVIDAALETFPIPPYTIIAPSLLVNKRSVQDGILYVDGLPLAQSHMRNHPLTPMWASDIRELMRPQGKYPCYLIPADELSNPEILRQHLAHYSRQNKHFYLCPDYYKPEHGSRIAALFGELPFLTGGSGLIGDLAQYHSRGQKEATYPEPTDTPARRVLLAGSCSVATRGQVGRYLASGGKALMLDPDKLVAGSQTIDMAMQFVDDNAEDDVLIYGSGSSPDSPTINPDQQKAEALEKTLAAVGEKAVQHGCRRLAVAGGETSGAVTKALGYQSFHIGKSVAPGVPMMVPTANPELMLVLKSGNFGAEDFFLSALKKR